MTPITRDEIEELERKAKASTPGKWFLWFSGEERKHGQIWGDVSTHKDGGYVVIHGEFDTPEDRDYIAAAHPETTLSLIARIRELEADNAAINARIGDAWLRIPEDESVEPTGNDLLDRLHGIYTIPVNDGAGPLDGKMTFNRRFPTLKLNLEAAARIAELEAMLVRVNGRFEESERKYYLESDRREELETALKPFAGVVCERRLQGCEDCDSLCIFVGGDDPTTNAPTTGVTFGDCRHAAAVLAKGEGK